MVIANNYDGAVGPTLRIPCPSPLDLLGPSLRGCAPGGMKIRKLLPVLVLVVFRVRFARGFGGCSVRALASVCMQPPARSNCCTKVPRAPPRSFRTPTSIRGCQRTAAFSSRGIPSGVGSPAGFANCQSFLRSTGRSRPRLI